MMILLTTTAAMELTAEKVPARRAANKNRQLIFSVLENVKSLKFDTKTTSSPTASVSQLSTLILIIMSINYANQLID